MQRKLVKNSADSALSTDSDQRQVSVPVRVKQCADCTDATDCQMLSPCAHHNNIDTKSPVLHDTNCHNQLHKCPGINDQLSISTADNNKIKDGLQGDLVDMKGDLKGLQQFVACTDELKGKENRRKDILRRKSAAVVNSIETLPHESPYVNRRKSMPDVGASRSGGGQCRKSNDKQNTSIGREAGKICRSRCRKSTDNKVAESCRRSSEVLETKRKCRNKVRDQPEGLTPGGDSCPTVEMSFDSETTEILTEASLTDDLSADSLSVCDNNNNNNQVS